MQGQAEQFYRMNQNDDTSTQRSKSPLGPVDQEAADATGLLVLCAAYPGELAKESQAK